MWRKSKLKTENEQLRNVLRAHNQWHLDLGEIGLFKDKDGEWIVLDMSAEYCGSDLYEKTIKALGD